jgi:hypothetical protein
MPQPRGATALLLSCRSGIRLPLEAWLACRTGLHSCFILVLNLRAPYYPIDVIKSTLQGDSYIVNQRKYKGFWHAAQHIYATSGIKGFYRGFIPCMARSFPANGVLLLTVCDLVMVQRPHTYRCFR